MAEKLNPALIRRVRPPGVPMGRREFLTMAGVTAATGILVSSGCGRDSGGGSSGPVGVASLLDTTGGLEFIGKPMTDATTFAVETINKNGGVLGRQIQLQNYDTQFENDKYTEFANQVALDKTKAVVMGGITSASREAVRPIFHNAKKLYFYNEQYEGGVCDRYTFATGVVPTQQLDPLIQYAIDNMGKSFYTIAADYNYGQISAQWVKKLVEEKGGTLLGQEFIPLEVAEHGATINKIQDAKPEVLMSLLVGANHQAFYRQWKAAGLKEKIPIVSATFGIGLDHIVLDPSEAVGVVVCYPYFQELDTKENQEFVKNWRARFGENSGYIIDSVNVVWAGWNLWAQGVEKAGSLETEKVIDALQSGLEFTAPSGQVKLDPGSHHLSHSVHIARTTDQHSFEIVKDFSPIEPAFEKEKCDLVKDPTINKQFTPSG